LVRSVDYPLLALYIDDLASHAIEPCTRLPQVANAAPQFPSKVRQACTILSWNVVKGGKRVFEPPRSFQSEEPFCFHVLFFHAAPRSAQPQVRGLP
jgi:hypothetical protein